MALNEAEKQPPRTKMIGVRVSDEEVTALYAEAKKHGKEVSTWLRELGMAACLTPVAEIEPKPESRLTGQVEFETQSLPRYKPRIYVKPTPEDDPPIVVDDEMAGQLDYFCGDIWKWTPTGKGVLLEPRR